ncbi:MAG TPA: hypothetical protein DGA22_09755 [Acidobacterium sp.]|nr:hypothetical protein [Acidobacterium sp.]
MKNPDHRAKAPYFALRSMGLPGESVVGQAGKSRVRTDGPGAPGKHEAHAGGVFVGAEVLFLFVVVMAWLKPCPNTGLRGIGCMARTWWTGSIRGVQIVSPAEAVLNSIRVARL